MNYQNDETDDVPFRLPNRNFVQYTLKHCDTEIVKRRLSLSDAKSIIDLLVCNEDAFGK